jgi:hypothetical protein
LTELDEVLDAVDDPQPSEVVDGTDVARVKPSFLIDELLRLLLVLVVAGDAVLAANADLRAKTKPVNVGERGGRKET